MYTFVNQGNLAESFLKIAIYLTFSHLIPYIKNLPCLLARNERATVRKTHPSHPRKTSSGEASPTFGHANANFSAFIDRIRNQYLLCKEMNNDNDFYNIAFVNSER